MKKRKGNFIKGLALTLGVFAALFSCGFALIGQISRASNETETEIVREAVSAAVLTCYAVEGAYPAGLDYLMENYGLAFDEDTYIVVYDAFASNIMPDIRVLEKGAGS